LQQVVGIESYVKLDRPVMAISQIYYRCGDRDVFFFANSHLEESYELEAEFVAPGKTAWLWNPETGQRYLHPTTGARNRLRLSFAPAESKVIVFDHSTDGEPLPLIALNEARAITVTGPWRVYLEHVDGSTRSLTLDTLVDFNTRDDLRSFAGVIRYEATVELPGRAATGKQLDLGKVFGVSEVTFNSRELGARWYGHHRYELGDPIQTGPNAITIRVSTTLGNYLKSLPNNKDGAKWLKKQPYYPMGLIGPVRIL